MTSEAGSEDSTRAPLTEVEQRVWKAWGELPEGEPRPVRTIAEQLGMEPADVAFIVFPAEHFGPWSDSDEDEDEYDFVVMHGKLDGEVFAVNLENGHTHWPDGHAQDLCVNPVHDWLEWIQLLPSRYARHAGLAAEDVPVLTDVVVGDGGGPWIVAYHPETGDTVWGGEDGPVALLGVDGTIGHLVAAIKGPWTPS